MTTHWARYVQNWQLLRPPLRPNAEVIDRVATLIGPDLARCLLLGSTSEYAALRAPVISVDATFARVATLWKGDDPARLGIQADWANMPIASRAFTHVLGDGSLNAVPFRSMLPALLDEVCRVLKPEGALIARVFCRPEKTEQAIDIRRDVARGLVESFHPLKWRIAMSLLHDPGNSDIAVTDIRDAVMALYPDRDELCRMTDWNRAEVDTLDVYEGSDAVYNFPTQTMIVELLRRWFADVEVVASGTYPLAERCPLLVARNPVMSA